MASYEEIVNAEKDLLIDIYKVITKKQYENMTTFQVAGVLESLKIDSLLQNTPPEFD